MSMKRITALALALAIVFAVGIRAIAHEMSVMGTVAGIEAARIQIKTGKEKAGVAPTWYPIDEKTKITRGSKVIKLEDAKIKINERVAVLVDHPDKGPIRTKEIRLGTQ
jgi:hypothetical protein